MLERHLQARCIAKVSEVCPGAVVLNLHGSGWTARGVPDLLMCIDGRFVAAELKVGKNGLSEAQRIWRTRIENAGGAWASPRTVEEFESFIKAVRDGELH